MHLLLHEIAHLIISLLIGFFVWRIYKKPLPAFIAALLGGFFIDLDHLFDYYLVFGLNFNLRYFLESDHFLLSKKIYVPFHAWEYVILFSIYYLNLVKRFKNTKIKISKYILSFLLALTLGIYSHLIIDTATNNIVLPGYSIIYRAINNYDAEKISNEKLPDY